MKSAKAARLMRTAVRRRADGSRGVRARHAWERIRDRAGDDLAVQDALREQAPGLPEADVLDLLAAAPDEPAGRAAYLALIGQDAQRQALDPDGSLLALAYRAAAPEVRERLRTVMAAVGDADVIRVVVTGERRDRIAEMTDEELDYLGHQLAERGQWDELRRLARDLPLAKAVAATQLLPEQEPQGRIEELGATIERLPRDRLITYDIADGHALRASFSPDSCELALKYKSYPKYGLIPSLNVATLRIATGEHIRHFSKDGPGREQDGSILHLGGEILISSDLDGGPRHRTTRVVPDVKTFDSRGSYSGPRRSGGGGVMIDRQGLAFIDTGADGLRQQPVPRIAKILAAGGPYGEQSIAVATLPEARLVALYKSGRICLADEDGNVLHEAIRPEEDSAVFFPFLSFLSPNSLVLNGYGRNATNYGKTEVWSFSPGEEPRRTYRRVGRIRRRWSLTKWRRLPLDDAFAVRMYGRYAKFPGGDVPWLHGSGPTPRRVLLAAAPGGDIFAVDTGLGVEVHSPHLPAARELLERPLLRSSPKDLPRVQDLRANIGDPAVRNALDLLAVHLTDRFGNEIALGTGPVAAGGPTDIALAKGDE